jgi:hypothetical protein
VSALLANEPKIALIISQELRMSVLFSTTVPKALLTKFDQRIAQTAATGKITTWEKHPDGVHYTHKAQAWKGKAYLKPIIENGGLRFAIYRPQGKSVDRVTFAYYEGHLIETFINHFSADYTNAQASPSADSKDLV